ncbi:hypothetical protein [Shewanella salipaludis]|uniref:Uncharacterized protein n=1 Tax=Shewanella salipaludis TaxID=2723052 RepID=A0A972FW83_9GAMM|nr:hypothetical protein [Shewanella salipaludis]NMH63767.1 hypothetical protein [Shewanella salipaludis]
MDLSWVIAGTIVQSLLAYVLFFMVAVGFSAIGTSHRPTPLDYTVLNSAIYVLPACCVMSAILGILFYHFGASKMAYLWYVMPLAFTAAYFGYIWFFIEKKV